MDCAAASTLAVADLGVGLVAFPPWPSLDEIVGLLGIAIGCSVYSLIPTKKGFCQQMKIQKSALHHLYRP